MVSLVDIETSSRSRVIGNKRSGSGSRISKSAYPRFSRARSGSRFYSPSLHTWISRDPIAEKGGINLYGFVANNPIYYVDSNGQVVWSLLLPILVGSVAIDFAFLCGDIDKATVTHTSWIAAGTLQDTACRCQASRTKTANLPLRWYCCGCGPG